METEFKPKSWQAEVPDLVKEYEAFEDAQMPEAPQTKPEEFAKAQVRKGILNPENGAYMQDSSNSKQKHIRDWSPSQTYKDSYEQTFKHV